MSAATTRWTDGSEAHLGFEPHELESMQPIIEAVCLELGVTEREKSRRKAVADRVMAAYSRGTRLPLNMVSAGLSEHRA
ncbi:hypothetical protein [Neoaquamicrobium sediminum]|uniref:Uncharacterized protein n=2 Tax=Neoaquamicrobium sediminum TaxID=1849104 RepID=A0ABV3WWZ9_9HYPH|nr:hypothetical protein [Mesorhizobium sp.]